MRLEDLNRWTNQRESKKCAASNDQALTNIMTEDKEYIKGENLYNTDHKTTNQPYRDNYDNVEWEDYTTDCTDNDKWMNANTMKRYLQG